MKRVGPATSGAPLLLPAYTSPPSQAPSVKESTSHRAKQAFDEKSESVDL